VPIDRAGIGPNHVVRASNIQHAVRAPGSFDGIDANSSSDNAHSQSSTPSAYSDLVTATRLPNPRPEGARQSRMGSQIMLQPAIQLVLTTEDDLISQRS